MANIGTFKKSGHEFQGEIVTLSLQSKGVRIVPETNRTNDNAPSHRVYVGRAEIGAAWSKRSNEGRDYLSVKLDDPSFTAPIYANLVEDGEDLRPDLVAQPQGERRLTLDRQQAPARTDRAGNFVPLAATISSIAIPHAPLAPRLAAGLLYVFPDLRFEKRSKPYVNATLFVAQAMRSVRFPEPPRACRPCRSLRYTHPAPAR